MWPYAFIVCYHKTSYDTLLSNFDLTITFVYASCLEAIRWFEAIHAIFVGKLCRLSQKIAGQISVLVQDATVISSI